jgi:hypothetical protein
MRMRAKNPNKNAYLVVCPMCKYRPVFCSCVEKDVLHETIFNERMDSAREEIQSSNLRGS